MKSKKGKTKKPLSFEEQISLMVGKMWTHSIDEVWLEKDLPRSGCDYKDKFIEKVIGIARRKADHFATEIILQYNQNSTMRRLYLPHYRKLIDSHIQNATNDKEIEKAWKEPSPLKHFEKIKMRET